MSEAATRQDIDEVIGILHDFMRQVDVRFDASRDARFNSLEKKIDERFDMLDKKYDHLINVVDEFVGRLN